MVNISFLEGLEMIMRVKKSGRKVKKAIKTVQSYARQFYLITILKS